MSNATNQSPKEMKALRRKLNESMNKKYEDIKFAKYTVETYKSIVKEGIAKELKDRKDKHNQ